MNVVVIGLGKIGLPLAVHFASEGNQVIGVDLLESRVMEVNAGFGLPEFKNEDQLEAKLLKALKEKKLTATSDLAASIQQAEVILVAIPLFVSNTGETNFEAMDELTRGIGRSIQKGTTVIYETTLPIGTTSNRFKAIIESESLLKVGQDFYLAFSPERVFSGRFFKDLISYPKIVGGVTEKCGQNAADFYSKNITFQLKQERNNANGVWIMKTASDAEFVKLAETTYRDVNIALSNQFAKFARMQNCDFTEITAAANSQPFSNIHRPGISVGGHCIPVYPKMYCEGDPNASLVIEARKINDAMPAYSVEKIVEEGLAANSRVLILGLSYRENVKETYLSGTFEINRELVSKGFEVFVSDPYFSDQEIKSLGLQPMTQEEVKRIDMIIVHSFHEEFRMLNFEEFVSLSSVFDGRNALDRNLLPINVKYSSITSR
jgi:nucleotide sugar dehydrogenase